MPNDKKEKPDYGPHKYPDIHTTNDCEYGCGCWAGPARSGGPLGLDPIGGECPNNPSGDFRNVSDREHYERVVNRRIEALSRRAYQAEELLSRVSSGEKELVSKNDQLLQENCEFINLLGELVSKMPEAVMNLAESKRKLHNSRRR